MITTNTADLFIQYGKSILFKELTTWVSLKFNMPTTVASSQLCYGDCDSHYWENINFYIKNFDTLFSVNIGTDNGQNINDTVIFIETNIYKGYNKYNVYVETDDIENWKYLVKEFYRKLSKELKTL